MVIVGPTYIWRLSGELIWYFQYIFFSAAIILRPADSCDEELGEIINMYLLSDADIQRS